ncbi:hypothetical protein V6N12_070306 [Hibiscus sabdariffa]|uniref:Uncharacterized protein n=1 Tax=Hibiscus sabdariffa TaxID=183260 RepID=A0ABR2FGF4_9ROSI
MKITKSSLCFTNNNRQQRDVFHGAVELLITVRESPSRTILWKPRSAANFRACNVEVASVVVGSRIFELSCEPAANTYPSESLIKKPELEGQWMKFCVGFLQSHPTPYYRQTLLWSPFPQAQAQVAVAVAVEGIIGILYDKVQTHENQRVAFHKPHDNLTRKDTLLELHEKSRYNAKRGGNVDAMGVLTSQLRHGLAAPTLRIPVPLGTIVKRKRGKLSADLAQPGDEELWMYNPNYLERPYVVVLNKIDLPGARDKLPHLTEEISKIGSDVVHSESEMSSSDEVQSLPTESHEAGTLSSAISGEDKMDKGIEDYPRPAAVVG